MKRNMDLIRDLLLRIEAKPTVKFGAVELPREQYDAKVIIYLDILKSIPKTLTKSAPGI